MHGSSQRQKILIFRLSSLGDIILATSALECPGLHDSETHWVVAREYADLLRGDPRISKVWGFDRSSGIAGWIQLCLELRGQGFDQVFDLHRSLRTRIARILFFSWKRSPWRSISKERWRLFAYFVFKRNWPKHLRPTPFTVRFAQAAGGSGGERPNFTHLTGGNLPTEDVQGCAGRMICVMPGSRWNGKKWPVRNYFKVLQETLERKPGLMPVVLGSIEDKESIELFQALVAAKIPCVSGIGRWSLREIAAVLASSVAYLGNDTGFAHLAEAVGVRALVIYGPTAPDMGFGPWRSDSSALAAPIWCRPCGKDGRACFRVFDRYRCLKLLEPEEVRDRLCGETVLV